MVKRSYIRNDFDSIIGHLVADRLNRNAILIELNPEYAAIADRRIRGDAGMFAEVAVSSGVRALEGK